MDTRSVSIDSPRAVTSANPDLTAHTYPLRFHPGSGPNCLIDDLTERHMLPGAVTLRDGQGTRDEGPVGVDVEAFEKEVSERPGQLVL